MNAKDHALTVDETNILLHFLRDSIGDLKSSCTGGVYQHASDDRKMIYTLMVIDKKLTSAIRARGNT